MTLPAARLPTSSMIRLKQFCAAFLLAVTMAASAHAQNIAPQQPASRVPPAAADPAASAADQQPPRASAEAVRKSRAALNAAAKQIASLKAAIESGLIPSFRMQKTLKDLEARRLELRSLVDRLTPPMGDAKARLEKLGPGPKQGTQEPPDLARQRKVLGEEFAAFDSVIKRAEVLFVQAGQALTQLNALRRARFTRQLLERSDELAAPAFWRQSLNSIGPTMSDVVLKGWTRLVDTIRNHPITFGGSLVIALMLGFGCHRFVKLMLSRNWLVPETKPSETRAARGTRVLRRAARASAALITAIGVFLAATTSAGLPTGEAGHVMRMSLVYCAVSVFLIAILWYALTPPHAEDRLITVDDRAARHLRRALTAFVIVWLGDQIFTLLDKVLATPLTLVILRLLVASMLYAGLLIAVAVTMGRLGTNLTSSSRTRLIAIWLSALTALSAGTIMVAAMLGYVSLARFAGGQMVATGGLLLLLTLIHLTAEHVSARGAQDESEAAEPEATKVGASIISATIGVALGIGLDLATLLVGIPLLLLQWGYDWSEVFGWIKSAYFGFSVGAVRISLETIFVALLILAVGIVATRGLRDMLMRRLEHAFARDSGVRDSLGAILTYIGFVTSVLVAISYLGISLSSLALVAGALSVGIGFGLQSIANNFVSGLILLAERPIKVGDWIVLGEQEGRVQKISVRSTEIRTFDRSTLIVPNSDLITGRVVNWTHEDTIGRVVVPIGVSYSADPREVIELLRAIGRDSPRTLAYPQPIVVFEAFGDNALEFTLRVYLRDVGTRLEAQTELRVAIFEALRERGIEIPFPQRDLHIRSDARADEQQAREVPPAGATKSTMVVG